MYRSAKGWPWALVEIGNDMSEAERVSLIRSAYDSSRAGLVALALRDVPVDDVDRVLDGVVDAHRNDVQGVVYLDGNDEEALFDAASHAHVVIASTRRFRLELARRGIHAVESWESARVPHA